jgi:hypothetical protein
LLGEAMISPLGEPPKSCTRCANPVQVDEHALVPPTQAQDAVPLHDVG